MQYGKLENTIQRIYIYENLFNLRASVLNKHAVNKNIYVFFFFLPKSSLKDPFSKESSQK